MSTHYLGKSFDIHGGGIDLVFPHHENEIAQSEAAHPDDVPMARIWMHNGFVNVDKEKMSKSLGNFVTMRDVLDRNDAEGFRWFLLSVQYRGPIQFDTEVLEGGRVVFPGVDEAERRVDYMYRTRERIKELLDAGMTAPAKLPPELTKMRDAASKALEDGRAALDDDLNSPVALAAARRDCALANEIGDSRSSAARTRTSSEPRPGRARPDARSRPRPARRPQLGVSSLRPRSTRSARATRRLRDCAGCGARHRAEGRRAVHGGPQGQGLCALRRAPRRARSAPRYRWRKGLVDNA